MHGLFYYHGYGGHNLFEPSTGGAGNKKVILVVSWCNACPKVSLNLLRQNNKCQVSKYGKVAKLISEQLPHTLHWSHVRVAISCWLQVRIKKRDSYLNPYPSYFSISKCDVTRPPVAATIIASQTSRRYFSASPFHMCSMFLELQQW